MTPLAARTVIRGLWHGKAIVGKPRLAVTDSTVSLLLPYYSEGALAPRDAQQAAAALGKLLGGRHLELRLVRLRYPYLDSAVLAEFLAQSMARDVKPARFQTLVRSLFRNAKTVARAGELVLPSWLSMVKVQLSGRLLSERVRPRQTVQVASVGQRALPSGQQAIDYARYETKNKRGALTVRVWLYTDGHRNPSAAN
jgi:ribosomal protein S3